MHTHDVVLVHEGHLGVDLGELGLAVGAEILVAEATGDLEVAVKARDHEQLLVELGGLGQGVELAVVDTGRNEVVSCSLGRGGDEAGGLDVDEAVLGVVVTGQLGDLGAGHDVVGHVGTAEVEVAVLEAKLGLDGAVLHDLKGRGLGGGEDLQLGNGDLDLTRGDVLVHGTLAAGTDNAVGTENKLGADSECLVEGLAVGGIVKGQLDDTASVAEVDEDEGTQVSLLLGPAHDADGLADVGGGELGTQARALVVGG